MNLWEFSPLGQNVDRNSWTISLMRFSSHNLPVIILRMFSVRLLGRISRLRFSTEQLSVLYGPVMVTDVAKYQAQTWEWDSVNQRFMRRGKCRTSWCFHGDMGSLALTLVFARRSLQIPPCAVCWCKIVLLFRSRYFPFISEVSLARLSQAGSCSLRSQGCPRRNTDTVAGPVSELR